MKQQTANPLSLDLASYPVFSVPGASPVAILNESSSLTDRLQYCHRAVENLEMLASLCGEHDHSDVKNLSGVFTNLLEPLSKMLGRLVSDSEASGRA
jgi:hypothetical protein